MFKHVEWIPKGPLYISFDTHDKILNKLSGKYNFHSLHNNIPSYQNKIPIYLNEDGVPESDKESFNLASVNLLYIVSDPKFVGWCFLTEGFSFLEGKSVCHFELPTTGNSFDIRYFMYRINPTVSFIYHYCESYVSETDPLALDSRWFEFNANGRIATIKIFSDREKFEEYQKNSQK